MEATILKKIDSKPKDALVFFLFDEHINGGYEEIDSMYEGKIGVMISEEFKKSSAEIAVINKKYLGGNSLCLLKLGKRDKFDAYKWIKMNQLMAKALQASDITDLTVFIHKEVEKALGINEASQLAITNIILATYQFSQFFSDEKRVKKQFETLNIVANADKVVAKEATIIAQGVNFARELGNMPAKDLKPTTLSKRAQEVEGVMTRVFGEEEIIKEGMGALHAVSLGTSEPPQLIIMEYLHGSKSQKPLVFVGKGITFDSGGIQIKPSDSYLRDPMKFDMLGGAAVIGALKAIADAQLKVNVIGLVPAAENMLGENAYRPHDILKARNGKTIEVIHTDAEGRLILADALCYAQDYNPELVVDLATLTGSNMIALGTKYAGIFSRNDEIVNKLISVSKLTGEKLWRLPLDDEFSEEMKSEVADLRNISLDRYGDASNAAAFLENFINYPWVHMDIAGKEAVKENKYTHVGATGFGVQTLYQLAKTYQE